MHPLRFQLIRLLEMIAIAVVAGGVIAAPGCEMVEDAPPRPRNASVNATVPPDVPDILRGTVMSQAYLDGFRDVIARGYGLVVGLKGTGHRILDARVRAHMLGEMARLGVGSETAGFNMSPNELLNSMDTAVVLVEAIIPPGAPKGTRFDVRVSALPGTETSSLEGGRLWTTDLRPALAPGLPPVGSRQARPIAIAKGDVFTNPFVVYPEESETVSEEEAQDPGDRFLGGTSINFRTGHVLGGGATTRDMPLKLRLATPSHNTAANLQTVINSYFPQEPGQRHPTARGESDASIEITIPASYHGREREFVYLLQHTSIFVPSVEALVSYVNRLLKENPGDAIHAMWRWQALGPAVLPGIREFYVYPEEKPRFAALHAGAKLNDPLVVPHLLDLAKGATSTVRKDAIALLGEMKPEPRIIFGLSELLNVDEIDVRVAAYEAMTEFRTRFVQTIAVDDGKYLVDLVESDKPLVYVALLGVPRIAVFGRDLAMERPMTLATWSGRILMRGDEGEDRIRMYYRDASGQSGEYDAPADLPEFISFLGHTTTIEKPMPGLGLSYAETVGVLWAVHQARYLPAEFRTEQDRILLQIEEQEQDPAVYQERPEFSEPANEAESAPAEIESAGGDGTDDWRNSEIFRPPGAEAGTDNAKNDRLEFP